MAQPVRDNKGRVVGRTFTLADAHGFREAAAASDRVAALALARGDEKSAVRWRADANRQRRHARTVVAAVLDGDGRCLTLPDGRFVALAEATP